jgi:chitin disaccharide deacetylase
VLPSTSMLVNGAAFAEAATLARERVPRLGVGLHLNLVAARPLAVVPTLTDPRTGQFHPLGEMALRAFAGRVSAADVRRECDAQLAALRAHGIYPTHLDSHRHAHALPGVLPAVAASASAAGIRVVRRPLDRPALRDPVAGAKLLLLHAAWRRALGGVHPEDLPLLARAPHFRGIALQGAPDLEARLLDLLDRLPRGATELMLHPGYVDDVLASQDPYRLPREHEIAALMSPAVRERLSRGDLKLARFDELPSG